MEQPTFADLEFTRKQHKTRREKLLKRLEGLVPWERLEARIEPHYPKAGNGRRPCALSVMLRVRLGQLCYNPVRDTHIQRKRDHKPTEAPDSPLFRGFLRKGGLLRTLSRSQSRQPRLMELDTAR